ncbi:YciI family protein [Actinomadura madurae]|uniref:YciI family protein n=1 Tax=Actinomadura madurae TaxID=1993 RepID=UPI003999B94E
MLHLLRLEYTGSEQAAEPHVAGHVAFLERHHAAGTFVLSGQTVPTSQGGLIIAAGVDRQGAEDVAAEDPFVKAGVARYRITTVTPGRAHPDLARLWR